MHLNFTHSSSALHLRSFQIFWQLAGLLPLLEELTTVPLVDELVLLDLTGWAALDQSISEPHAAFRLHSFRVVDGVDDSWGDYHKSNARMHRRGVFQGGIRSRRFERLIDNLPCTEKQRYEFKLHPTVNSTRCTPHLPVYVLLHVVYVSAPYYNLWEIPPFHFSARRSPWKIQEISFRTS